MRKGFIMSVDALVALGIVMVMLGMVLPYSKTPTYEMENRNHMQRYASDALFVMLKSGAVDAALAGNRTAVTSVLSLTSPGKCLALKAYAMPSGNLSFAAQKAGCNGIALDAVGTAADTYYNGTFYSVEMVGWLE